MIKFKIYFSEASINSTDIPRFKFSLNCLGKKILEDYKSSVPFFAKNLKANNSKSYRLISVKFYVRKNHHSSYIPCKFQTNQDINDHFRYVRRISDTNSNRNNRPKRPFFQFPPNVLSHLSWNYLSISILILAVY